MSLMLLFKLHRLNSHPASRGDVPHSTGSPGPLAKSHINYAATPNIRGVAGHGVREVSDGSERRTAAPLKKQADSGSRKAVAVA